MAKGQKKSTREAKKPKKSEADRLKAKAPLSNLLAPTQAGKTSGKK